METGGWRPAGCFDSLNGMAATKRVTRIGIVSDTHVPVSIPALPKPLLTGLSGVDLILHAGDLVSLDVLDRLDRIAPTTGVYGNMDPPEVCERLSHQEIIAIAGRSIGLKHGHQRHALQRQYITSDYDAPEFDLFYQAMAAQLPGSEIIVFGHFHRPLVKEWNGITFINPGAVTPSHGRSTFAILELGDRLNVRMVELDL